MTPLPSEATFLFFNSYKEKLRGGGDKEEEEEKVEEEEEEEEIGRNRKMCSAASLLVKILLCRWGLGS